MTIARPCKTMQDHLKNFGPKMARAGCEVQIGWKPGLCTSKFVVATICNIPRDKPSLCVLAPVFPVLLRWIAANLPLEGDGVTDALVCFSAH
jgi:hypothetical protein